MKDWSVRKPLPLVVLIVLGAVGAAIPAIALADAESVAIAKSLLEREARAWNVDGKVDLAMLATDVDIINAAGPHWHGRDTAAANGQQVLDTRRPKLSSEVVSAERIAPNVILAISRSTATMPEGAPGPKAFELHQMRILVKSGDQWLVRALTSTPIIR